MLGWSQSYLHKRLSIIVARTRNNRPKKFEWSQFIKDNKGNVEKGWGVFNRQANYDLWHNPHNPRLALVLQQRH